MHSSRMCTVRCSSRLLWGEVSARGVVCPSACWDTHPLPREQKDRCLWKHNLSATTLRTVKIRRVLLPPATKLGQGNIFTPVCHSVHRGGVRGCSGGVHGCSRGGMHGCSRGGMRGCSREGCMVAPGGACVVALGGCAWLLQGGCAWLLQGGVHGIRRHTEIRSMSGRYTSYWNAFLLQIYISFVYCEIENCPML